MRALANFAHLAGKEDAGKDLEKTFGQQKPQMNDVFWIADKKRFAFALDSNDHAVDEPTVLSTVPMWFGLLDEPKADSMITQLADLDQQTDWGMRIISDHSPKFSGGGYHYGSVWPLFTGWAAVGEYRYHRAQSAYENLRANALLGLDGSLGHFSEVLSGAYYQSLSTSSPHQIWSAAMVLSPILRGMLGLETDAIHRTLRFTPHVPADWTRFTAENVRIGQSTVSMNYKKVEAFDEKTPGGIFLEVARTSGSDDRTFEFRPAISLLAKVLKVDLNGKPVPFKVEPNASDQHVVVQFPVKTGKHFLRIYLHNDFGLSYQSSLPKLGSASRGLRILSETWSPTRDQLTLEVSGASGGEYELKLWGAALIREVHGAERGDRSGWQTLRIHIPPSNSES